MKSWILIIVGFMVCGGCVYFPNSNQRILSVASSIPNTSFETVTLKSGIEIRTMFTGEKSSGKPLLIFVHGAPGNVLNFRKYHSDTLLTSVFNVLSYDRPGYGKRKGGKAMVRLEDQSTVINELVYYFKTDSVFFFAHSFGGAIVLDYMARYHDAKGAVLAATAVDPLNEKFFWFSPIGKWKLTRMLLPRKLKTTGSEKYSHVEELELLEPKLGLIDAKITAVHGTSDSIVPFQNLDFLQRKLTNSEFKSVVLEGENHFFPLRLSSFMTSLLIDLVDEK